MMTCLLCGKKIPRIRAWWRKSEFCSDEHATAWNKETVERLLEEPAAGRATATKPFVPAEDVEANEQYTGSEIISPGERPNAESLDCSAETLDFSLSERLLLEAPQADFEPASTIAAGAGPGGRS